MALPITESSSLIITPPPFADDFDSDSVDLRLGLHFFVPMGHRTPCFCPGTTPAELLYQEQYIPLGGYVILPAHSTVLAATMEYIKLPFDMAGLILTKSSWARTFITIETAPWVHPLYRGCLTLEIANASNTPIVLYPGVKIAQLVLMQTVANSFGNKDDPPDCIEGTYIGPVRPEPASMKPSKNALAQLGVRSRDISYPGEYLQRR